MISSSINRLLTYYMPPIHPQRIAWLAPYPVHTLRPRLRWGREQTTGHACSWIVSLAQALARQDDIDLHIVTLCPWVRQSQTVCHEAGYTIHVVKSGIPLVHRGYPGYAPLDALTAYRIERMRIRGLLGEINPDIVHAHGTEGAYGLAAMDAGYPWLISLQGIMAEYQRTNPSLHYRLTTPLEKRVLQRARYIGTRTHFDRAFAGRINPRATILDLPEAMNEVFYEDPWSEPENMRILFVGSCIPRKGLHRLIEALGLIVRQVPDMVLEAVGGGSPEQKSRLEAQARGLGVRLNFLGIKQPHEIAALHRACRLFVIPSENENSPNALAEAMASGMPCIAFNTGGIASMMQDAVSGLLVPFGDTSAMARAILRVLQSKELRGRLSAGARSQAERNRPAHVAQVTRVAYDRILTDRL